MSILYVVLLVSLASGALGQVSALWPMPKSIESDISTLTVDATAFHFQATCVSTPLLLAAFQRYHDLIFNVSSCTRTRSNLFSPNDVDMTVLNVCVASSSQVLQLGVDESFQLYVNESTSTLQAQTIFGAMHGLEVFSQLVQCSSQGTQFAVEGTPIVISDSPRFPWRGLLIDTSRHYLPVNTILRTIDALTFVRMNTLHWHAVDAQSFPIESTALPDITAGAWAPEYVYSQANIANVVSYGLARGVRVVVEFDTPGHAASWGVGYPQLTVVDCPSYTHNINNIPLNPTLSTTYELMQKFFAEMASLFTDNYLHFGGDEVVYGCWAQDNKVLDFMHEHGFNFDQLLNYYFQTLWQPIDTWNKTPVVWQEVFLANVALPQNSVVHIWQDPSGGVTVADVVAAGHKGIVSPGWYLDHLDQTWQDMYAIDPTTNCSAPGQKDCFNITNPVQRALVLGGEAAMWGEQVDQTNIESRVWPRAAAVAERLWSPAHVNDPETALNRLIAHRCRMFRRGINVAPLQPGYC